MKKFLLIAGAVVVVLVALVVIAPFVIPVDTYKAQIAEQAEKATGRQLTLGGDISLSLFPPAKLTVSNVAFANREGLEPAQMAELERLEVKVDPLALLGGELVVDRFVLHRPRIHLAIDEQGQPNWTFGPAGAAPEAQAAESPALKDVRLGDVRLVDGTVSYSNAQTGDSYTLDDVNLTLTLTSLDQPMSADGSAVWNGETVEVTLETGAPRGLMQGQATPVALAVESAPITLDYDGQVTSTAPLAAEGGVTLDIPSLKGLADWAGQPLEAREGAFEAFNLKGRVEAEGQRFAFVAESLQLDAITGTGEFGVDVSGAKPSLKGRLDLARLDVTPYMPPPPTDGAGAGGSGAEQAGPAEWSDAPMDMSALGQMNADFALTAEGIVARDIEVGESALALRIQDGRLTADLQELNLYGGSGTGKLVVDASGETPAITKDLVLSGVSAGPLLADAADFDRLEGTADARISVKTRGRSQKAMVEALGGAGGVEFTDGAIKGINLAAMVRNVKSAYLNPGAEETQKTDFAELSGTFTIEKGVLRNDDLLLLNPLLRLTGSGRADLAARTVDYRVLPKAVATLEGQGGEAQKSGIAVPVIIEGPWHDISYRPDVENMVKDILKDPSKAVEGAKGTVEGLKEGAGGGVKGVIEGLTGQQAETPATGAEETTQDGEAAPAGEIDPGKTLKKLFGD